MFNFSKVQKFENELAGAKKQSEMGKSLVRLLANKDFKKIIMEEFTVQEAARFAAASGDPTLSDRERADALSMAQAPGRLKHWITIQLTLAHTADSQIEELVEGLEEARLEEAAPASDEDTEE